MTTEVRALPDRGPTPAAARALGPDLARGFMLLFIALANSHYFLRGESVMGGYPLHGPTIDSLTTWLLATFVDGRAFPLFGLLFGYGVAQIARRHAARGPRAVRRLLWRRSAVLVAVGLTDALLFFAGDVLALYGVLLLLGAWLVRWRDRWLLLIALAFAALGALPSDASSTISRDPPDPSMLPPDVLTMLTHRIEVAAVVAVLGPLGFLGPFAVGLWAGRRILEHPRQHRRLLRVTAAAGITAAVLGAQPISLMLAGLLPPPAQQTLELLGPLHDTTGILGGFGYAALLALIAARFETRRPPLADAIAATGQRSMTCYLLQSVAWALVFTPFLLDLSTTLTVTTTALLAATTWSLTVLTATHLSRAGRRGPFESLIRRVTYGPTSPRAQPAE